jgi:hypothetical protein
MIGVSGYSLDKVSLEEKNVAFVVVPNGNKGPNSKEDSDKPVGAYIPKLMSEINMEDKPWIKRKSVSSSMIKNDNVKIKFSPVVQHRNYYNVKPLRNSNVEQPALYKGEHFWVKFLDGDIKKGVYEPKFMDENLRSHDRHRIFIKDKASVNSPNKEYEFLMDSEEQVIRIFMDNGRGEKEQFTIEVNGKAGHIELKGTDGESVKLGGGNVTITAPGTLTMNAGKIVANQI